MTEYPLRFDSDIRYLKGVGEKRAASYKKMGIETVGKLIYHLPRGYIDLSQDCLIASAQIGGNAAIRATVIRRSSEKRIRKGLSIWKVLVSDGTIDMTLTFYNAKFSVEALKLGSEYIFYGPVGGSILHKEMSAPMIIPAERGGGLMPRYPSTAGLSSRLIGAHVSMALNLLKGMLKDPIPQQIRRKAELWELDEALAVTHRPPSLEEADQAKRRFIFEEFFILAVSMQLLRRERRRLETFPMNDVSMTPLWAELPFSPTSPQLKAIDDVFSDLRSGQVMNRLLQGDVGSGKTLVAAVAAYFCCQNGCQAAMMAPTEILAEQHYETMSRMLTPLGVRVGLLTGLTGTKARREMLESLMNGDIDFVVGTHALLGENVKYKHLSLVITDEQHRFGVAQRAALGRKGEGCHMLVMSATPIPRTLSLLIYGDLDISLIDKLPEGRKPILTYQIDGGKRRRAFDFIKKQIDVGGQAYIVCPIIEESELSENLLPAVDYAEELAAGEFSAYQVGLLHGRMKSKDKEGMMRRFKEGEIQLLVSTTVIEVGVDVPNATVMMIENAERFGLSQLHQLRGRIGRGSGQSYCILVTDSKNPETLERIEVIVKTTDGFAIADADLRLRGPGDFFGYRQHGLPQLSIADMTSDVEILHQAQQAAKDTLDGDPRLSAPENQTLFAAANRMMEAVSATPN